MFVLISLSEPSVLWLVFGLRDNDVVSDICSAEEKNTDFPKMGVSKLEKEGFLRNEEVFDFPSFYSLPQIYC